MGIRVATPWVFSQDLGFFDPILGSGFYHEDLGFFLGIFKSAWVVLGFSKILGNIMFFLCFLPKSKELFIDLVEKWYVVGESREKFERSSEILVDKR